MFVTNFKGCDIDFASPLHLQMVLRDDFNVREKDRELIFTVKKL